MVPPLRCNILGVTPVGWHLEAAGAAGASKAQLQRKLGQLLSAPGLFPAPIQQDNPGCSSRLGENWKVREGARSPALVTGV